MKISRRFGLGVSQYELDFVDIDTDRDIPLFIDPFFIGIRNDSWSMEAARTLRNFFQTFVTLLRSGAKDQARAMFNHLHEPNETCLGLSRHAPRGNAIGEKDANKLFVSIAQSRAIATGIVEDLEDFRLFIPGIDKDKISDMATNVIRAQLIRYTQSQCKIWGIPLQPRIPTGFYWDAQARCWSNSYAEMLVVDQRRILLTPKAIVSYAKRYTSKQYHSKFVLEYLQSEHLSARSVLVQERKDGTPYVTKKNLTEKVAPHSKEFLAKFTQAHPDVFNDFKAWVRTSTRPIRNEELATESASDVAAFLVSKLKAILPGNEQASLYHRTVVGILELVLYPDLVSPVIEKEIHEGRKRIDISFDNAAPSGFFHRVHTIYRTPAQFVFAECKNYTKEVANPELDQLAGRFSMNRGKVGLLIFRSTNDMQTLINRCSDTYKDDRGVVLPICDSDLVTMLERMIEGEKTTYEDTLMSRFRSIALA